MSKMISIPEEEYNKIREENNSLRELLRPFLAKANKLVTGMGEATKQLSPKNREAQKVTKMTGKQRVDYYMSKIK